MYSQTMKELAVVVGVILGVTTVHLTGLGESIVFFILTGHISLINVTIPPLAMLAFWVLVVPITVAVYKVSNYSLWEAIELIGKVHQRHLNRSVRWVSSRLSWRETALPLVTIYILYTANQLPDSHTSIPALAFRRRFLTVPAT